MICPKCSSDKGWDGPKFVVHSSYAGWTYGVAEYLQYRCKTCGYDRHERCHDYDEVAAKKAKEEAQILAQKKRMEEELELAKRPQSWGWLR